MSGAALTLTPPEGAATGGKSGGRIAEFLLTGGATLALFPIGWLLRGTLGLDDAELAVGFLTFHAAHLINDPHFSVTYLLFYKDARRRAFGDAWSAPQRVRFWVAGLAVPLVLAAWLAHALSVGSATSLGLSMQLMFLLVGWHYGKQGFGVLTVLSARQGVSFSQFERRAFLAHCFAGWAYAWASPRDPGREVEQSGVVYTTLGQPPGLELATGIVFGVSTLLVLGALVQKWRRERRLPPLAPLTGFFVTIWLWMVYSSVDPLMVYMIPALHSVQYLYFVWLLKRNEARAGEESFGPRTRDRLLLLAVSALVLGWVLFRGAPDLLDGAAARAAKASGVEGPLGPTPFFAAFFAFVNIHHYFMDHVIWRRENPETRFLRQ
jgi:hypothetical protein